MNSLSLIKVKLKNLAFIDFRALAAFRISLGLILISDILIKSRNLTAFFTDEGIMPTSLVLAHSHWWNWSLHLWSGSWLYQFLLMVVGFILGVILTLGYQSRIIAPLCWIFICSFQGRNLEILHAGDALFRVLLFWSMFLDLSKAYSVDSLLKTSPKAPGEQNIASFAILFQLLIMYFFTALLKNDPVWNREFTAIYYALNLEQFTTSFGRYLLNFPDILKVLTAVTYHLELIGPLLLLLPVWQKKLRVYVPLAFVGLHISLYFTMYLGTFPWICIAAWLLFFPSFVWDKVDHYLSLFLKRFPLSLFTTRLRLQQWPAPFTLSIPRALTYSFLSVAIVFVAIWNVYTLPGFDKKPQFLRNFNLPLKLDQSWAMFAPYPLKVNGWFVIEGALKDGTIYDPWNRRSDLVLLRPERFLDFYRHSTQWRKYMTKVWMGKKDKDYKLAFGRYICREFNRLPTMPPPDDKKLSTYKLYHLQKVTPPPGEESAIDLKLKWEHDCFAKSNRRSSN